jgi:DivIVA domain-containing protein
VSSVDLDDAESLRRIYVDEGRSLSAIAQMAGCSYATVRRALLAHAIEIRRSGPAPIGDLRDKAWLEARVEEGCSAKDIAGLLGCAEGTARSALHWAGLGTAGTAHRPPALDDAAFLERVYVVEGRSARSIAEEVGCTKDAVLAALRHHGVAIRKRGRTARPDVRVPADAGPDEPTSPEVGSGEEPVALAAQRWAEPEPEPMFESEPAPEPEPEVQMKPGDGASTVRSLPDEGPAMVPDEPVVEAERDVEADFELEPPADDEDDDFAQLRTSLASVLDRPSPLAPSEEPPAPPAARAFTPTVGTPDPQQPSAGSGPVPPSAVTVPPGRIDVEIDKIETKTFPITRRGYDRDEVDAFLRSVAADYRQVVRSAKEAVNAARAAAPPPPPPPAPAAAPAPPTHAFEDIGGHVTAVLTSAAEAAEEIKASAEKEALAIRHRAREETEHLRRAAAEALAEAERVRAATEQEAAEADAEARARADALLVAAQQRAARLEDEAQQRLTTMDRTVRANIDAVVAEARRDYEHLRSAQQQCVDRLASVEFLAKHARDGLSENAGLSIDDLL